VEQSVARQTHNLEVAGSSPAPAITVRVQHHPARPYLLPPLLARLDAEAEVVTDPDPDARLPSPWRTYRACLAPSTASHLLVLQDDAILCRHLVASAALIARDDPVLLFVGGAPVRLAHALRKARSHLVPVTLRSSEWMPLVAVLWPTPLATAFRAWADRHTVPRSDDAVAGQWVKATGQPLWATAPSLVEHDDRQPSLVRRHGRSPWRRAHAWIGPDADPLALDWA
jgi:hypothetical protein